MTSCGGSQSFEAVFATKRRNRWPGFIVTSDKPGGKVVAAPNPAGRYHIHELLRQFVEERLTADLTEKEQVRDRHCAYYTTFLQEREANLKGAGHVAAVDEIEAEIENVRAAWDWAVTQGRLDDINQSLDSLALFHEIKCWHKEGEVLLRKAAEKLHDDEPSGQQGIVLAKVLSKQGLAQFRLMYEVGQQISPEQIKTLLQESLSILDNLGGQDEIGDALSGLSHLARNTGDFALAQQLNQQAFAVYEQQGDQWGMARVLENLGYLGLIMGAYTQAKQFCQQGIAICEEIGSRKKLGDILNKLGTAHVQLGEYEAAQQTVQAALAARTEANDKRGIGFSLFRLGNLAWRMGNYEEARQRSQESAEIFKTIGLEWGLCCALNNLGDIACTLGRLSGGRRYFQAILKSRLAINALENDRVGDALAGLAAVLIAEGQPEHAAGLLTLVLSHPTTWQETKDRATSLLSELEGQLSPHAIVVAKKWAETRPLADVVAELLGEAGPSQPLSDERGQPEHLASFALLLQLPGTNAGYSQSAPQLMPFVGRADELIEITGRLRDPACRLLTLVGPGGMGKTRLALQAAQSFIENTSHESPFRDGVYFVDLTPVTSPDLLVSTIAGALDFTFLRRYRP